ncbi:MAG: (d)CMP kinase [Gammaproteobacteria bacterium]
MIVKVNTAPVITLDGPGGSGKGTVSRLLARQLGWHFLDSGALYRLVALGAARHRIALEAEDALMTLARHLDVRFEDEPGGEETRIYLDGEAVTDEIRLEECGELASKIAALPEVRFALLDRQRAFKQNPGLIADGRDMGTVVFPDADLKIFLTASPEERARRRHKQLKDKDINVNLDALLGEIKQRDERDAARSISPMIPASDALVLDSSDMSIEAVVSEVMRLWFERQAD